MKKKFITVLIMAVMACQLAACSFEPTCKVSGCGEAEIYKEGYCKYHYYQNVGEGIIKDFIN